MTPSFPAIGSVDCIEISGADARRFAQAQFSGDVDVLEPGHWQWNAWLTAQGRVRALMQLADCGDGRLLMVLRGGDAEATRTELARYLLRMRATLSVQTLTAHAGGPIASAAASLEPDGAIVLGYGERSLRLAAVAGTPDATAHTEWHRQDIHQGWPTLPSDGEPEFLPPALGLERLGAVAFDKGCYPGQEIATRLHHRGGHKYQLCHLRGPKPVSVGPVPTPEGAPIVWVLDAAPFSDGIEVLAVTHVTMTCNINMLDNIFSVVSRFDP